MILSLRTIKLSSPKAHKIGAAVFSTGASEKQTSTETKVSGGLAAKMQRARALRPRGRLAERATPPARPRPRHRPANSAPNGKADKTLARAKFKSHPARRVSEATGDRAASGPLRGFPSRLEKARHTHPRAAPPALLRGPPGRPPSHTQPETEGPWGHRPAHSLGFLAPSLPAASW